MRNLKRVLALALALIMTLGLMITASAASYPDADQIDAKYNEAVEVLSGLGVFKGQGNGGTTSFAPKAILTRGEAATLVYRILTGDVKDAQIRNYDYTSFEDVKEGQWWTGYITYSANGGYVKGYNGYFNPQDEVTGVQVLAIMLRAIGRGQNGEYEGAGWKDNVLTDARDLGLLKGVATDDLDKGAARELVAQLLFNAITIPNVVTYSALLGYRETAEKQTLGNKVFGLTEINGVVTANEYADLYDDEPLAAGKTTINGVTYNTVTTLDDIGETHRGWATGKTVLYFVKTGTDAIFETGDAIASKDLKKTVGMDMDDAEKFLNFSGSDTYTSDYRIEYVIDLSNYEKLIADCDAEKCTKDHSVIEHNNGGTLDANNVYTKPIKAGAVITAQDISLIKDIFTGADYEDDIVLGEVYVGTSSIAKEDDISDEISYKTFVSKYLEEDATYAAISANENGNWLKVIDNDGDGNADYVLKTVYTMAQVDKVAKNGAISLDVLDETLDAADKINEVDKDIDVVTEDELAVGDIVYYAVIDGNAQTYLADVITAEIDKVNRNTLTATTTDGDEYVQSGICNHIQDGEFEDGVKNLTGKTSYDLYFDKFGYLAAFTQTATSGDFTLLVDGYFDEGKYSDEYSVRAYVDSEIQIVDVTERSATKFINKAVVDNNGWTALRTFDGINNDGTKVRTIVASLAEDGTLTPVEDVYNKKTINIIATEDNVIPKQSYVDGTAYYTAGKTAYDTEGVDAKTDGDVEVRGLASTVYYYVYGSGKNTVVKEYVGYSKLPTLAKEDEALIEDVYVVGTQVTRSSGLSDNTTYYTANVVVVEFKSNYRANAEQVFIYDSPVVSSKVTIDDVDLIRADGTQGSVPIDLEASTGINYYGSAGDKRIEPGLYYMYESSKDGVYVIDRMSNADIYANRYTVGQVITTDGTGKEDYVEILAWYYEDIQGVKDTDAVKASTNPDTPQYVVLEDSDLYTLSYKGATYAKASATLKAEDLDTVFAERMNTSRTNAGQEASVVEGTKTTYYNYNDVLVSYDKSGNVIYAVSFANDNDGTNYAQDVWTSVQPEKPVTKYDLTVLNHVGEGLTITLTNAEGGEVTLVDGKASVLPGTYKLTVTETEGYTAGAYYVANDRKVLELKDGVYEIEVDGNTIVEITGVSEINKYTVTENSETKDDDHATVAGLPAAAVNYGSNVTFSVTTDDGYSVAEVKANDTVLVPGADGKYTITNITANQVVTVTTAADTNVVTFNYYTTEGKLIVSDTQKVEVETDDTVEVVLGKDADYIYVVDEEVYAAGDAYELTGDPDVTTVKVTVYPATVDVTVNSDEAIDTYLKWTFTVAPSSVDNETAATVTLTATANNSSAIREARTIGYTVNSVDGTEIATDTITSNTDAAASGTASISIPALQAGAVTINITSITW